MRTLFIFLLILLTLSTHATNYYFSTLTGSDARTPAQAENASTPWQTLGKLNSFFINLKPGDSVLFKRNETFFGSIQLIKSGLATTPITIGAYGTGNKPVITSLVNLTDWIFKGKGIWETSDNSLGATLNNVLLNNTVLRKGRYPNIDEANDGYLYFESHKSNNTIIDKEFPSAAKWAGAELVLRTRRWLLDRNKILSNTDTSIRFTPSSPYEPYDKYGYFIQNSLKTLDQFGEWYYNPVTKKLSIYFGSAKPVSYSIRATSIANLISSYNISNVVLENIVIRGANEAGIDIQRGSNIAIKNCDILFSGTDGVTVRDHTKLTIEDCYISNSNNNGINFVYGSDQALIKNNRIVNTSLMAGMGLSDEGNGLAIYTTGNGSRIEANEIRNTGYIGIAYSGNDVIIKNNFLDSFCLIKDDGAGIYAHGSSTSYTGRKIIGNIVMNGIGAGPGTENAGYFPVSGVYMDNNAAETEIADNTLMNCNNYGIYIHNSFGMTIRNNTLFNNSKQLCMIQDADNVPIRDNTVTNNIMFSKYPSQFVSYLKSSGDDIKLFARFDSNYYARPLDDRITIYTQYVNSDGIGVTQNLDLDRWKERYGMDKYSKKTARQIEPYNVIKIKSASKIVNGSFDDDVSGASGTACAIAHSNAGMMEDGYLEVMPSSKKSLVNIKAGMLTGKKNYILRYTVRASEKGNMTIGAFLRQDVSPYGTVTATQMRAVGVSGKQNELLFSTPDENFETAIVFRADEQSKYFLDNITLREADAEITSADDSIRIEYNAGSTVKTFKLDGSYLDTRGKKYLNNLVLQPYTSVILMKSAVTINEAPEIALTNPLANEAFIAGAAISIKANATDADGSITKVEFYSGSTLLGFDDTSPYTFNWNKVASGNYEITAKATDNDGLTTASAAITIFVSSVNQPPTVDITTSTVSYYSPATILLTATANDADGKVKRVEFYNGTILLKTESTAPYAWNWEDVAPGNYTVTAKAYDNEGLVTTSAAFSISVLKPNEAPTVMVVNPFADTVLNASASIRIIAEATDLDGSIAKVEIFSGNTLLGTEYLPPYTFRWNNIAPGNYAITARATDNEGSVTLSDSVMMSVIRVKKPPTVIITSPIEDAVFTSPAQIDITTSARDAVGSIERVEFYNGSTLLGTALKSPYTLSWKDVPPGTYTLTAKAYDNEDLVTISAVVSFTVAKIAQLPTITFVSPISNSTYLAPASILISAAATDPDGSVAKVEFFHGDTLIDTEYTSPYLISWNNVAPGNYVLTAKATGKSGLTALSEAVTISVTGTVSNQSFASRSALAPSTADPQSSDAVGMANATSLTGINPALSPDEHNDFFNNQLNKAHIKIGPNPTRDVLTLYTKGLRKNQRYNILILSVSGRRMKTFNVDASNNVIQLNLSSLTRGIYFLKLVYKDVVIYKQFKKQ